MSAVNCLLKFRRILTGLLSSGVVPEATTPLGLATSPFGPGTADVTAVTVVTAAAGADVTAVTNVTAATAAVASVPANAALPRL